MIRLEMNLFASLYEYHHTMRKTSKFPINEIDQVKEYVTSQYVPVGLLGHPVIFFNTPKLAVKGA